jgi:hypothetical protein
MAIFIVKTLEDRNLVLQADSFRLTTTPNAVYEFVTEGKTVASVPAHNVFAVIDDEVREADFYWHDDWTDDIFDEGVSEPPVQDEV